MSIFEYIRERRTNRRVPAHAELRVQVTRVGDKWSYVAGLYDERGGQVSTESGPLCHEESAAIKAAATFLDRAAEVVWRDERGRHRQVSS